MYLRLLLVISSLIYSLNATPNVESIKQALHANPALLNTPQAQAEMKKRGVTQEEVQKKLSQSDTVQEEVQETETQTNDVIEEAGDGSDTLIAKKESSNFNNQRLNPFKFSTSEKLRGELQKKKSLLITNKLSRYSKRFYTNQNKIDSSSLPTPDNYIISTGDKLNIYIYGDRDTIYNPTVNNEGSIELPFIGPVKIGGMEYSEAKKHLEEMLKNHFKMSEFNININKYSTIQVTLIGDIAHPGLYNLSSFSTLKDLFIASKGINATTSVRDIKIKRDGKIIENADFYDLLFEGEKFGEKLLKHGDIVVVKKADILVSIDGYVNNSAIFELKKGENLSGLLHYAGGMKAEASKLNIKIKRFSENAKIETFELSLDKAKHFKIKNGDSIVVYPLDESANASVNIYGNIIRPGSYPITAEKTLNKLLQNAVKDGRKKFFLPQTYFEYGVVKRYSNSLSYETLSFSIEDLLQNKESLKILPQDEIYIFSHNDLFSSKYITTKGGALRSPGKLQYYQGMTISDAIHASGVESAVDDTVKVTTFNTEDLMPKTNFYSLESQGDTKLSPYDEVEVLDYYDTHILEPVSISGEVVNPTTVFYEKGMNLASLIKSAGGFNKKAYTKSLTINRYFIDETQTRQQKVLTYDLNETKLTDIYLKPYDEVKISTILGWGREDYQTVSISGEVQNPKTIKYGQGLSLEDMIITAGGLTQRAYTDYIEIVRYSINEDGEREHKVLQFNTKETPYSAIKLDAYDKITIFKIPQWNENKTVELRGEVRFPGKYTIETGERLSSVIERAGGFTDQAFIEGAVFTRESIKQKQIEQYNRSLAEIKRQLAIYNAMPANSKKAAASASKGDKLNEVIEEAKKYKPVGRISIKLDDELEKLAQSEYNLALQDGDVLAVPSHIDTVSIFGEVFNPSSFVYRNSFDSSDYIKLASGYTRAADESRTYIIHADGTSEPAYSGWFIFGSSLDIAKGDTIVVPIYIQEYNQLELWDSVSKIMASFAITAATLNTLGLIN